MELSLGFMNTVFGLIAAVLLTIVIYKMMKKSDINLPPGPFSLPLVGTIYKHGLNITADTVTEMSKVYGNIFCIFLGTQRYVVMNDYDVIHDAMTRSEEFSHRGLADKYTWKLIRTSKAHGLFTKDYNDEYIHGRNLSIGILRKLGIGKSVMEEKILEEIDILGSNLRQNGEQPQSLLDVLNTSIGNVTLHILINKRFEHGDKDIKQLIDNVNKLVTNILYTTLIDSMPTLRFIQPFKGILQNFVSASLGIADFMKELTAPMLEHFDPDHNDSFVESYFEEHHDHESNKVQVDLDSFKFILGDLITAGIESPAIAVRWTIVYLANRQNIQKKLYRQMASMTEPNQPIRYSDKERLPYLEAVVWEVQRFCTLVPLIIRKSCDKDVQLGGYCIPKNTMVLLNHHTVHTNENTWGDPLVFRPERFINEDGKFVKHPQVIPFSIGKRACLGEILAKQELYLFTANLIKKFRFYPPDNMDKIDEEPIKASNWCPKPFKVKVVSR